MKPQYTKFPIFTMIPMSVTGRVYTIPSDGRRFFRVPILTEYMFESPNMGYRVLDSPLNVIPVTTISYENPYFHQYILPVFLVI